LRQGFGACRFFQWEDAQETTTINDIVEKSKHDMSAKFTLRSHQLVSDMGDLSIEHSQRMEFESVEMENLQHSSTYMAVPELCGKEQEPLMERGQHDETSTECRDPQEPLMERGEHDETECLDPSHVKVSWNLQDLVMQEAESRNPIMKKIFIISHQTSLAGMHHRQTQFRRQTTAAGDTSTGGNFLCLFTFNMFLLLFFFFFFFFFAYLTAIVSFCFLFLDRLYQSNCRCSYTGLVGPAYFPSFSMFISSST
jgi:hypothetical protein